MIIVPKPSAHRWAAIDDIAQVNPAHEDQGLYCSWFANNGTKFL
jgi:hypothetical protein